MSTTARLEHANLTVPAIEPVLRFLLAALPGWRVRGEGRMDWYGKTIRWLHVGTDDHYLALQDGGEGELSSSESHALGVKHLGFEVADLDETMGRLEAAGYRLDHFGAEHPHRRRVYYVTDGFVQVEFVQYRSALAAERNLYD